jgi:uncharacterized protein (DUF1697 family)
MATWVVLLRGINVGGKSLPMAALREIMASLGHGDVSTYIQSGNALMNSDRSDRDELAEELSDEIERVLGLDVTVILRTPAELATALTVNPFRSVAETARVTITFLSAVPDPAAVAKLEPDRFAPDRFELIGSDLFMHYPGGIGRSKMTLDYFEKRLGVRGTARNLNTVAKLIELAGG